MVDYSAWLIEMQDGGRPVYFHICDSCDWTSDHNEALHLARKDDAEKIIAYYGWTRAKPSQHLWPEPTKYEVIAESNGHSWIKAFNLTCCRDCGIVRRADDRNRPCKGSVQVKLRSE